MTQGLLSLNDAVALYAPAVVTSLSSAMSSFDDAMIRVGETEARVDADTDLHGGQHRNAVTRQRAGRASEDTV